MKYNKLVRDKIPEHIAGKGEICKYHIADDTEYWKKLKAKCQEELNEFITDESIEELADLLEVIEAVAKYKQFSQSELARIQKQKREDRGGFTKRIILDES